jgi:amino acid transporter
MSPTAASEFDITARKDVYHLKPKAVGLIGVLFLTLTGSAPITAMLLNVPIVVGNGNGLGAPAAFIVATAILLVFSVGYAAMAGKVTAVGGFYSFISHGLGRELGMATGFCAVVAYSVFEPSLCGGFAYFMNLKLIQLFNVNVPWPILALGMVVAISVLSYLDVKISSGILGVALVTEVIILLLFDGSVFAHNGGITSVQVSALNPSLAFQGFPASGKLAAGAAGIGLFFAFWSWVGFEMAPNYAEESKDPKRIVPLSLYISVIALGVFYTVTCWAAQSGYPAFPDLINEAQNNSATFFFDATTKTLGPWSASVMSYLILTGSFACGMAFHNTAGRYLYSLGREKVLPAALGKTHSKHKTPYVASFVQSIASALVIAAFAVFVGSNDPNGQAYGQLYGLMALLGTILILSAQALVSVAIIVYFRTHHPEDQHWWKTIVAPALAFVAQVWVVWLAASQMAFLGGGFAFANYIIPIDAGVFVIGLAGAFYLKQSNPEKFAQIGRMIYQGVPDGMLADAEHAQGITP